jgi:RING finger protein 113A
MFNKREKKTKTFLKDELAEQEDLINSATTSSNYDNQFLNKKRTSQFTVRTNYLYQTKSSQNKELVREMVDGLKYQSTEGLQNLNHATRELEVDTERDKDAMARHKRKLEISKEILEGKADPNIYRGKDVGAIYLNKSEKDISRYKVTGSLGPMRAPTNLRVNCRFDYAPGICKDYKMTGFCGFGDSCVFMHDRGDYKSGWELEEEWRREQLQKEKLIKEGKYIDESDDESSCDDEHSGIPLICPICDKEYVSPVKTVCEHYFCEKCAFAHYGKSSTCYVCKKPTQGIFNNCEQLIETIKSKRKAKNKNKEKPTKHCKHVEDIGDAENDNVLSYLDNREKVDLSDDDEKEEIIKLDKKKKNKFKIQNSWLYQSDYKSYN